MIDWAKAQEYDLRHDVGPLFDAFEIDGGCGHDLGLTGVLAIVKAWEKIRSPEKLRDLNALDT